MPAAVSEKPQQVGKENFAIRSLQFCGLIKRHAAPASRLKPLSTSHNAEVSQLVLIRFTFLAHWIGLDLEYRLPAGSQRVRTIFSIIPPSYHLRRTDTRVHLRAQGPSRAVVMRKLQPQHSRVVRGG